MLKLFFIGTVDYKCLILIIGKMQLHSKGDIYSVFTRLFKNLEAPEICRAAVQQYGRALQDVPEELREEKICLAAVKQHIWALQRVPVSLKTNVEALAKLYTTSEQQLRSDLTLLQINDDLIEEVICSLKAPIAKSSSMIVDLLGTGKDSKQNHVESRGILPESGVLSIMQEYVHSPSKQENDASESNDFTNFTNS